MAQVSMDLNELDSLRRQLTEATKAADNMQDRLVEKEKELVAVEANKMVIKKTIYARPETVEVARFNHDQAERVADEVGRQMSIRDRVDYKSFLFRLTHAISSVQFIPPYVKLSSCTPENGETVEYINFDDVQRELRGRAEASVAEELGELRQKVRHQTAEKAQLEQKHKEEVDGYRENWTKQYKQYDDRIVAWQQKYDDLLNDKDMRTEQQKLEAFIVDLQDQLYKEQQKPWWKKLFS